MKTRYGGNMANRRVRHLDDDVSPQTRTLRSGRVIKTKVKSTSYRLRSLRASNYAEENFEQLEFSRQLEPVIEHVTIAKSPKVRKPKIILPPGRAVYYFYSTKFFDYFIFIFQDECCFCQFNSKEVYELGELTKCQDVAAHFYCLLFAPGLTQNGQPHEGIEGFLLDDIRKELKRGKLLKCSYCSKRGAVVGCTVPECKINYHLPCGIDNGAFNQFHDKNHSFPSFCKKHRPKLPFKTFKGQVLCTICQEHIKSNTDQIKLLYLKCCQTYFHRDCLVKLSFHQGEFHLKCPNCKNETEFVQTLKNGGIFVPCRHATWEMASEPISDYDVMFQCNANVCKCGNGRTHNGDNEWELFACDRCGSNAIHVECAGLNDASEWVCEICSNV